VAAAPAPGRRGQAMRAGRRGGDVSVVHAARGWWRRLTALCAASGHEARRSRLSPGCPGIPARSTMTGLPRCSNRGQQCPVGRRQDPRPACCSTRPLTVVLHCGLGVGQLGIEGRPARRKREPAESGKVREGRRARIRASCSRLPGGAGPSSSSDSASEKASGIPMPSSRPDPGSPRAAPRHRSTPGAAALSSELSVTSGVLLPGKPVRVHPRRLPGRRKAVGGLHGGPCRARAPLAERDRAGPRQGGRPSTCKLGRR